MRNPAIARNYADTLLELATGSNKVEEYAGLMDAVAGVVETSPEVTSVLMSPRVPKAMKASLMGQALRSAPPEFVRFIQAIVRRGRQSWFSDIARAYDLLVDAKMNRLRASVIMAREPSDALKQTIAKDLSKAFNKEVLATYLVEPGILGGTIVMVGERVYDGSVRRKMVRLKRQLLA